MDHVRREGLKIVCDSEDEESDGYDGDGDGNGDAGAEMNSFENSREECKLVLVVRTDLGMGKGTFIPKPLIHTISHNTTPRQNRSAMLPRNPRLLHHPPPRLLPHYQTLDPLRATQNRPPSTHRRPPRRAARESAERGALRKGGA